jgi:adenosine deaminase
MNTLPKNLHEFIAKIPKSDLHVHLDGSVRVPTIIELSKAANLPLPSYTEEGMNKLVFKDNYANLFEYLAGFANVLPIMQTPENIEKISYEFAIDNINEGVCYVEVKLAPHLHVNEKQNIDTILLSVNKGLNRAKMEYNQKPEVKSGELPEFNYGIVVCAMRFFTKEFSTFYAAFIDKHQDIYTKDPQKMFALASYELIKDCVKARDNHALPIVAFDLVGSENGYPPQYHKEAFHFAHQNFMHIITHAGEATGPESIYSAITELYSERIGHGTSLFNKKQITDPKIAEQDQDAYIARLVQHIADRRITIEVCLTSNLQTLPYIKDIKNHSFAKMRDANLSTAICTDNRTFSKTNVSKELTLATQNFNLSYANLKDIVAYSFKRSFYPGNYNEKRNYIKKVMARYEKLAATMQ